MTKCGCISVGCCARGPLHLPQADCCLTERAKAAVHIKAVLHVGLQAVKDLIRISDEQRRFVMRVLVSQESMETFGDPNSMFMQATSISQFGGAPVAGKQGPASSLSIQADASEQQLQASGTRCVPSQAKWSAVHLFNTEFISSLQLYYTQAVRSSRRMRSS